LALTIKHTVEFSNNRRTPPEPELPSQPRRGNPSTLLGSPCLVNSRPSAWRVGEDVPIPNEGALGDLVKKDSGVRPGPATGTQPLSCLLGVRSPCRANDQNITHSSGEVPNRPVTCTHAVGMAQPAPTPSARQSGLPRRARTATPGPARRGSPTAGTPGPGGELLAPLRAPDASVPCIPYSATATARVRLPRRRTAYLPCRRSSVRSAASSDSTLALFT